MGRVSPYFGQYQYCPLISIYLLSPITWLVTRFQPISWTAFTFQTSYAPLAYLATFQFVLHKGFDIGLTTSNHRSDIVRDYPRKTNKIVCGYLKSKKPSPY